MEQSYEILLDTNFIMVPIEFKINIKEELERLVSKKFEIITLDCVIKELDKIKGGKIGKEMIEKLGVEIKETPYDYADEAILEYVKKGNVIVCTNDIELKNKLKEKNVPIIFMRAKQKLALEGYVE